MERGDARGLLRLPGHKPRSRLNARLSLKNKAERDRGGHLILSSGFHVCTQVQAHTAEHTHDTYTYSTHTVISFSSINLNYNTNYIYT